MRVAKEGDILSTTAQTHQQDLERLKSLRYIDDDFMAVCLADNYEGVELILRIVLGREDIIIKAVRTQEPLKNLQGRSAILDVHAVDSTKREFDVEIQRSDAGAEQKTVRKIRQILKNVTANLKWTWKFAKINLTQRLLRMNRRKNRLNRKIMIIIR